MTTSLEEGEGSASHPGRSLPPGKTRYPLYRRLGGSQGRSGQVRKISPAPGFDSRTVQPIASRYTDWATRPTAVRKPGSNWASFQRHDTLSNSKGAPAHLTVAIGMFLSVMNKTFATACCAEQRQCSRSAAKLRAGSGLYFKLRWRAGQLRNPPDLPSCLTGCNAGVIFPAPPGIEPVSSHHRAASTLDGSPVRCVTSVRCLDQQREMLLLQRDRKAACWYNWKQTLKRIRVTCPRSYRLNPQKLVSYCWSC